MPKFTVITEGGRYEFENDSVANVADLVREIGPALNLSGNLSVNGVDATPETPVTDEDEIYSTKAAGTKGA